MRDHQKLKAFALADRLALAVYQHTADFPREEIFGLTAQLRRAAVSVPSNIVEGCARHSEADYLHFLDISYASRREVEYQLSLAVRLGYLATDARSRVVRTLRRDEQSAGGLAPGSALVAAPAPTYSLQSTAYGLRGRSIQPRRRLRSKPFGCGHPAALCTAPHKFVSSSTPPL